VVIATPTARVARDFFFMGSSRTDVM